MSESKQVALELKNINKSFGSTRVIQDLSVKVLPHRLTALVGESGCGKTTCLRLMNGLIQPDSGDVYIDGKKFDYSRSVETRRQMGYCLQGYTLFPHLTVFENVSLIASKSGWTKQQMLARAEEVLELVHLSPSENLKKKPNQLSGGQRQRVGFARALFMKPKILLLDEPFGALDPITRGEIQDSVMELQEKLSLTMVLVTHDLSEAFKMATHLVLLQKGSVAQEGRPNSLLTHPANEYVRSFLKTNSPAHILKSVFVGQVMSPVESKEDLKKVESLKQSLPATAHLKENTDLLCGLNVLLKGGHVALPVLNKKGEAVGLFTNTTLDILNQEEN